MLNVASIYGVVSNAMHALVAPDALFSCVSTLIVWSHTRFVYAWHRGVAKSLAVHDGDEYRTTM